MSRSPSYMKNAATSIKVKERHGAIFLTFRRDTGGVKRWEGFQELGIDQAVQLGQILIEAAQKAADIQARFDALDAPRENA